jgi:hypothetical protein
VIAVESIRKIATPRRKYVLQIYTPYILASIVHVVVYDPIIVVGYLAN